MTSQADVCRATAGLCDCGPCAYSCAELVNELLPPCVNVSRRTVVFVLRAVVVVNVVRVLEQVRQLPPRAVQFFNPNWTHLKKFEPPPPPPLPPPPVRLVILTAVGLRS